MSSNGSSKDAVIEQGQRLLQALKQSQRRQADLARAAGVTQGYISSVCAGDRPISPKIIDAAVALLGVDRQWLLFGDHPKVQPAPANRDMSALLYEMEGLLGECRRVLSGYHQGHLHDLLAKVITHRPTSEAVLEAMLESLLHLPPDEG